MGGVSPAIFTASWLHIGGGKGGVSPDTFTGKGCIVGGEGGVRADTPGLHAPSFSRQKTQDSRFPGTTGSASAAPLRRTLSLPLARAPHVLLRQCLTGWSAAAANRSKPRNSPSIAFSLAVRFWKQR